MKRYYIVKKNPPNSIFGTFLFGSWHVTKSNLCMLHGRLFMELSCPDLIVFSSNGLFFRTLFESINIWRKIKIGFHVWKIFFWIRIEDNFVIELFWLFKIFQRPTNMFEKMNQEPNPIVINASLSPHPPDISHVKPSPHLTFGLSCKCWQKRHRRDRGWGINV